jgi:hypothetical protein
MTLRQPHQDAIVPAGDIAVIRQALSACSAVLGRAGQDGSPELRAAVTGAAEASGLGRAPGALAYQVNLAIDILDFAPAAGSTR